MAATVHVWEYNDATGIDKNGAVIRFQGAWVDKATADSGVTTANPIVIPASNYQYSCEKWLRLYVTAGTYTSVGNTKFYWDGTFNADATNYKLCHRIVSGTPPTWVQPAKPAGSPGTFPPATFSDSASSTSASPLSVYASTWGTSNATGAGANQSYLVLCLCVGTAAAAGATAQETFTWTWDEVS